MTRPKGKLNLKRRGIIVDISKYNSLSMTKYRKNHKKRRHEHARDKKDRKDLDQ